MVSSNISEDYNLFNIIFKEFIKHRPNEDLLTIHSNRDITPFIQVTGWAEYLREFCLNKTLRINMLNMLKLPSKGEDRTLETVHQLCIDYLAQARTFNKQVHELIRKALMNPSM